MSDKKEEEVTTALVSTKRQEKYNAILKALQNLKSMEGTMRTSGRFYSNGIDIDITKEKDISKLVQLGANIVRYNKDYEEFAYELKLKTIPVLKFAGYEAKEWLHDIKIRLQVLTQKETREKLEHYKTKLEEFFSKEDKEKRLFDELESELGV